MAASTIEEYLAAAPVQALKKLEQMRSIASDEISGGIEVISYGIPAVRRGKAVIHFAGYKSHIGFYPGARIMADFEPALKEFKRAKGSVQFPLDIELPETLIREMIRSRLKQMESPE